MRLLKENEMKLEVIKKEELVKSLVKEITEIVIKSNNLQEAQIKISELISSYNEQYSLFR